MGLGTVLAHGVRELDGFLAQWYWYWRDDDVGLCRLLAALLAELAHARAAYP